MGLMYVVNDSTAAEETTIPGPELWSGPRSAAFFVCPNIHRTL